MEIIQHCCQRLQDNVNLVDRRLGLADLLTRTIQRLDRCNSDPESPNFPKDALVVTAVIALRSSRPVVIIEGLNVVFHLIVDGMLSHGPPTLLDSVPLMSTLSPLIVGKPAVWVLLEGLCHVMQSETLETAIQMKAVSCVAAISSDSRLPLQGHVLTTTVQGCFNLGLLSTCAGTQARARQVLRATLRDRVVRPVVEHAIARGGTADTVVPSFMMHAPVHRPDLDTDPIEYLPQFAVPAAPRLSFGAKFAERNNLGNNNEIEDVPASLRDLVHILESFFVLATQSIPSSVKLPDEIEVRTRQLALDCITCILLDFPETHGARQDQSVLAPTLVYVEDSLWECIGVNIATTVPSSFFVSAAHLLGIVATRAHYTLFPSLRKFFERVVFPLVKSRYSTLEQKIGLLSVVRSLFSKPELVVAYFCNYDCLAPLEHDIGLLQFIVHNVVEMSFLDYTTPEAAPFSASSSPGSGGSAAESSSNNGSGVWVMLTGMQQASLRCECLSLVGMLVEAMWRWLEDPLPLHLVKRGDGRHPHHLLQQQQHHQQQSPPDHLLSLADSAPSAQHHSMLMQAAATAAGPAASTSSSKLSLLDDDEQQQLGEPENAPSTLYHWKHIHHALVNRMVEIEARQRFEVNWKQGRQFLIDKRIITDSPADFAWWIRNTSTLKRGQVIFIFEKMLRDTLSADIVKAYIRTFDFRHKYVDLCLRDVLVSLMSDDSIPKFESQILERIMALFAEAYFEQNEKDPDPACALTVDDVDGMANVALMLHTANHNPLVKDKMSESHFVVGASQIVKKQLPDEYYRVLFARINKNKWSPKAATVVEITAAQEWRSPLWSAVPTKVAAYAQLWGGQMASHSEYFGSLRLSEQLQLRYIQRAAECFAAFKTACGGGARAVRAETRQAAYCAPFYAAHVRLMLRLLYPVIAVASVLANKMCFTGPQITLAQTLNHHVMPLMSLFGIDAASPHVRVVISKLFQKMLEQEHVCNTAFAGHPGVALLCTSNFA